MFAPACPIQARYNAGQRASTGLSDLSNGGAGGGQRGGVAVCATFIDKSQLCQCVCVCALVVSSHGSLGAGDKQSGVGYKVGPSQTPLSVVVGGKGVGFSLATAVVQATR